MCLREASDHLAHAELAEKLEVAMETAKRRGSQVGVAFGAVVIKWVWFCVLWY